MHEVNLWFAMLVQLDMMYNSCRVQTCD